MLSDPMLAAALGAFAAAVIGAAVVALAFVAASTLAGADEPARMLRAALRRRPRTELERPENAV